MKTKLRDLKNNSSLSSQEFDYIAGEFLNLSKAQIQLQINDLELEDDKLKEFKNIESQAATGTPPQYIFGKAYFGGNEFLVNEHVLIPRPETEILISEATNFLKHTIASPSILDMGTGSGIIAISLKKQFPDSKITAADVSKMALEVAAKNALDHNVEIAFVKSNLFENISAKFDLICANLPYIDPNDPDLASLHDPKLALEGGRDGFELIEQTIDGLAAHLKPSALAIFEIGYNQASLIKKAAAKNGFRVEIKDDLNGYPRIALLTK